MKDEFISGIGIWGQRHYRYLKENRPAVINVMRMKRTLKPYLEEANEHAEDTLFQLVNQMAKAEGITEQLKTDNQMEWVRRMNSIRNRAEEIVLREVIYS